MRSWAHEYPRLEPHAAHVRKSEEDANRTNPEVEHDPESERVSEEEMESFKTWEKDEQENPRSY